MIARGGTWDTNLKVVARKTPRRAMPVQYNPPRKDPNPLGDHRLICLSFHHFRLGDMLAVHTQPIRIKAWRNSLCE